MLIIQFVILFILLVFSSLFSGIETALMSVNMVKVQALLKQKKKGSKALGRIKKNPHKLIITILIGNNIVNIGAASLATYVFTDLFGSAGVGIATGVMTFLILVFGEITPKTYATQNAERISLKIARSVELLSLVLTPLVVIFEVVAKFMGKLLGSKGEEQLSPEELRSIVTMGRKEGLLSKEAADIMENVLEFKGTHVTEIMTPRNEMQTIDGQAKLKEVIDFLIKNPYSRYPVYINTRDNIKGILYVDDVLPYATDDKWDMKILDIAQKPIFVPETKEIDDLLAEFEGQEMTLAIVVNEYGSVLGIVSVEDILEEIVGEIFDKSKKESLYVKKEGDVTKVDADVNIEDFNETFDVDIKPGRFNTLAGFIEHKLQRIPKQGEKIRLMNYEIIIDDVTEKQVKRVRIEKV